MLMKNEPGKTNHRNLLDSGRLLKQSLRPILCSMVFCVLFLSFLSCSKRDKPRIGVVISTMQETVYFFMKQALTERMHLDNLEVIWVSSENNSAQQQFDVEALLAHGIDVLIIQPVDTKKSKTLVARVKNAGIPVIALDRLPHNVPVDLFVTADNRKVGQIQAETIVEALGGSGNLLILEGDSGNSVTHQITDGNISVLEKYPGIHVLMRRTHRGWSRDLAQITMEDAISTYGDKIDGVLANNSGMAMAALNVLRRKKIAKRILIVGSDADKDACRALISGEFLADIDKRPYELGKAAYEAAKELISGQPVSYHYISQIDSGIEIPIRLTPVILLTKENVKAEMHYRWGEFQLISDSEVIE